MAEKMSNQLNLDFNTAHARRDDPLPSFIAADKMNQGKLSEQQAEVLQAFRDVFSDDAQLYKIGVTARELSRLANMDYYKIQRRVNELESKRLIYRMSFLRDDMTVWRLK